MARLVRTAANNPLAAHQPAREMLSRLREQFPSEQGDRLREPQGVDEVRFGAPAGLDTAALAERLGAAVTEVTAGEYLVAASGSPALVAALTAWLAEQDLPLADLRAGRQRLEDVFLRLVAEPGAPAVAQQPSPRTERRRRGRG